MYRSRQGKRYPSVHLLTKEQEGYLPGWYFHDEAQQLHGPFSSLEETASLLDQYGRYLKRGPSEAHSNESSNRLTDPP